MDGGGLRGTLETETHNNEYCRLKYYTRALESLKIIIFKMHRCVQIFVLFFLHKLEMHEMETPLVACNLSRFVVCELLKGHLLLVG